MQPTIEQLVTTAKEWPQMKLVVVLFLLAQRSGNFFTMLKYMSVSSTDDEPSELYQSKWYLELPWLNYKT